MIIQVPPVLFSYSVHLKVSIFVGNLPFRAEQEDVIELFAQFGEVVNCALPLERDTGRKRGFAFVEMSDEAAEEAAIEALQGAELMGRPLRINKAEPRGSAPRRGGGGGGYGGNSLTQNNGDTSIPGAGPTTTENSAITLYTSDGEQYSGEYHQMENGTYHSGTTHDATLPEGHQILTQTPPANPTEVPNTTRTQSSGYSDNSGSGYGLAQSKFDIFNNVYEAEGVTIVTNLPQNFQLPFKGTNLSVFTTSNISRKNELLSSIERYTTGLTFELNNISDYKLLSSLGVSHISG